MKKVIKGLIFVLTVAVCLQLCLIFTAAEDMETEDWVPGDSISLEVLPTYADEIFADRLGAFEGLGIKEVYITEKLVFEDGMYLSLILVLEEGEQIDIIVSQLEEDARFTNVRSNVPTETINTLQLTGSSDTVKVGETLTLRLEGTLEIGSAFDMPYETIDVVVENCDTEKEYTPADFPQFAFSSVETIFIIDNIGYFTLKLAEPGYCNFYRAIHALALDCAVLSVISGEYFAIPDSFYYPVWEISDTSVADFATSALGENGEMVIMGLQPGTVTITCIPSFGYYLGTDYAVTYEITVTEADTTAIETTESTSKNETETTDTAHGNTKTNPQTSDRAFTVLCVLGGTALVGCAAVATVRYRKRASH